MDRARALLTLAMLVALPGCLFIPGQEEAVGRQAATEVEASIGFVDDPELSAYVTAIGQRLALHSPRQDVTYQFYVVDMAEANAFALPGGYVYVSRGLLALVNSEDELACVIGHEIGHVADRHAARRNALAAPFAIATGVAGAATSIVSPSLGQSVAGSGEVIFGGLLIQPFSRQQEHSADRIGMELAAAAGWDPAGMSGFLHTLDREVTLLSGGPRTAGFLDSHPSTPERVQETEKRAGELQRGDASPIAGTRADFLARLDGLLVGQDPEHGLFRGTRFLHPVLNISLTFPEGWLPENERQLVYAASPESDAVSMLHIAARGDDPRVVVDQIEEQLGEEIGAELLAVNGLPAARAQLSQRTREGKLSLDVTWIGHHGLIYQLTGVVPEDRAEDFAQPFGEITLSFRTLPAEEKATIRETRLRRFGAQEGETLPALVGRAGSNWSPERTAVANALEPDHTLTAGQLLKLAIPQPYTPR